MKRFILWLVFKVKFLRQLKEKAEYSELEVKALRTMVKNLKIGVDFRIKLKSDQIEEWKKRYAELHVLYKQKKCRCTDEIAAYRVLIILIGVLLLLSAVLG